MLKGKSKGKTEKQKDVYKRQDLYCVPDFQLPPALCDTGE